MRQSHRNENPPGVAAPDGLSKVDLDEITREISPTPCIGKAEPDLLYLATETERRRTALQALAQRLFDRRHGRWS